MVGKVRQPAVLTLPEGSRVQDALEAAGVPDRGRHHRPEPGAGVGGRRTDPHRPAPSARGRSCGHHGQHGRGLIDINTASMDQLQQIPGVGPVLAQRIVTYREQNGDSSGGAVDGGVRDRGGDIRADAADGDGRRWWLTGVLACLWAGILLGVAGFWWAALPGAGLALMFRRWWASAAAIGLVAGILLAGMHAASIHHPDLREGTTVS